MAAYDHIFDEFISTNIGNVGYQWQKKIQVWFDGVQQYFSYIVAVSFISEGNQRTRRKPPTCRKSLTNFIT